MTLLEKDFLNPPLQDQVCPSHSAWAGGAFTNLCGLATLQTNWIRTSQGGADFPTGHLGHLILLGARGNVRFLKYFLNCIYLFLAMLGVCCCVGFSLAAESGEGLLIAVASCREHRL